MSDSPEPAAAIAAATLGAIALGSQRRQANGFVEVMR